MAMDGDRLGTAIKNAFQALNGNSGGMTPAEVAQMEAFCQALAKEIVKEIKDHADIVLAAADIPVGPGSFANAGGPVTGVGASNAVTLSTKIK
jgi:hypothetical protein